MAQFIGLTVSVTLKDPVGVKVRGLVTDVVEQCLYLSRGKTDSRIKVLDCC